VGFSPPTIIPVSLILNIINHAELSSHPCPGRDILFYCGHE
jgi:hypothetical protein